MSEVPVRVLLVDDEEDAFTITRDLLARAHPPHEIEWAQTYEAGLAAILRGEHDVGLIDYRLGGKSGLDLLREATSRGVRTPLIFLTAHASREVDLEAMRAGAVDYLVKRDIGSGLLERSIRYARERARTLDALRESKERYARAVRGAKDGIWDWDRTTDAVYLSPNGLAMLGYAEADLATAEAFFALMHPEDVGRVRAAIEEHAADRTPHLEVEYRLRHRNGAWRWLECRGAAERDASGKAARMAGTLTDVTARKEQDEALRQRDEQLRQAQKMEAMGRLAGGMAHDLNNVLTAVIGYSDMVLSTIDRKSPIISDVDEIRKAARRAAELVRQMLTFSRRQVLQPRVVDLNDIVSNLDKMLRRLIGADIELLTITEPALGAVRADPSQIEQVIVNLAVNARDAMPEGGKVTIETSNVRLDDTYARAHVGVTPGPHVMLAVSDTGLGMDEATRSRIFEPFFTTKEQGKGTGLGLSIVYGIVKQSGGNIWVYSEPGQGTTFKIYLPRVAETPTPAGEESRRSSSTLRGSETVLVVEDDDAVRHLVRRVLVDCGYTVMDTQRGDEAVKLCEALDGATLDLLLTDMVMPDMSGRELAARLGAMRPGLRILYMSGYTDRAVVHHGMLAAGTIYLEKPFTPSVLAQKVREALEGKTGGAGAISSPP